MMVLECDACYDDARVFAHCEIKVVGRCDRARVAGERDVGVDDQPAPRFRSVVVIQAVSLDDLQHGAVIAVRRVADQNLWLRFIVLQDVQHNLPHTRTDVHLVVVVVSSELVVVNLQVFDVHAGVEEKEIDEGNFVVAAGAADAFLEARLDAQQLLVEQEDLVMVMIVLALLSRQLLNVLVVRADDVAQPVAELAVLFVLFAERLNRVGPLGVNAHPCQRAFQNPRRVRLMFVSVARLRFDLNEGKSGG